MEEHFLILTASELNASVVKRSPYRLHQFYPVGMATDINNGERNQVRGQAVSETSELSAFAAGAIKPTLFPDGGLTYVISALGLLCTFAFAGILVERWLLNRKTP